MVDTEADRYEKPVKEKYIPSAAFSIGIGW